MTLKPWMPEDEEKLVKACQKGGPAAQEALIKRFQPIVERHVSHLLRQYGCSHLIPEHQTEIVQQIWAELFGKIKKFPPREFAPWFAFLRRWKTLDYIRKELKYQGRHAVFHEKGLMHEEACSAHTACPEDLHLKNELRLEIRICMQKIPIKQQEFMWLFYFRGWTYEQIAKKLNIGVSSIGSLHTRAIRSLKKNLKKRRE